MEAVILQSGDLASKASAASIRDSEAIADKATPLL